MVNLLFLATYFTTISELISKLVFSNLQGLKDLAGLGKGRFLPYQNGFVEVKI